MAKAQHQGSTVSIADLTSLGIDTVVPLNHCLISLATNIWRVPTIPYQHCNHPSRRSIPFWVHTTQLGCPTLLRLPRSYTCLQQILWRLSGIIPKKGVFGQAESMWVLTTATLCSFVLVKRYEVIVNGKWMVKTGFKWTATSITEMPIHTFC